MAEQQNPTPSDSDVQRILSTIKEVESSGNYGAKAKGSTASGAYQFINDTWQRSTKRYGIGTEYKTAADAPPEVQDAVAARAVKDILGQVGGDVTKVPLVWYTGNPQGRITEEALRVNRGLTPDKYQQKWLSVFNKGSPTATMAAQTPAQPMTQAPRTMAQATPVVAAAKPSLTDMPAAYRMALAANYLADTESPETSVVERAMEMLNEQQGGAAKNPLAGYMQAISEESVNPFQFVQQEQEEPRRRAVPRLPVRMEKGGAVDKDEFDQQKEQERQSRLVEQGLSYAMGPMDVRAVRKPSGYEARVSGSFNQVVPYMDFDPLTGTFRPTEVGVSYGQMGPEGGYQLRYGQPLPREGQGAAPPQITGQYRRQLDRNSEVQASGYYVPIPGAKDQYGAQFRYLQRFSNGGEATSQDASAQLVQQAYRDILQKTPDAEGLAYWTSQLVNKNLNAENLYENIAAAAQNADAANAERYASALQNKNLVTKTYQDILNRTPDQEGMSYWIGQLNTGALKPEDLRQNLLSAAQGADQANAQRYATNYFATEPQPIQTIDPNSYRNPYGPTRTLNTLASLYSIANTFIPGAQAIPIIHYGLEALSLGNTIKKIGKVLGFAEGGQVVHRQAGSPQQGEIALRTPSISEVPQVDVRGRVIRDVPVPQPTFTPGQQLIGAGETALSALSGLTAPASIAYDVLRGVPAKEVSPSRFMYEPRTEAGQETLQNVGRLAQEYKLDVAMPQVQLQRPYPVGAAARQGIAGLEKGVEKMTLPTFRQLTGNPEATKEEMMDFVLNQKNIMQAGAPAISRAPGGTFFTSEGSNLQRFINRGANEALDEIGDDPEKAAAVSEMFYKKAQDFFEKRAGSISDELKQEMLAGRIKMPGEIGEELFPKYLREAAQRGDISAMRDIERRYDEMLGIKQIRLAKENLTETYAETQRLNQATKQSILAQFKQYPELIPDDLLFKLTNKDPTDVRIRLKDNPEYFSTVLEPKLTKLINIETEIVKPSDILNYESTYGRYAAENLSKNELEAIKRNKPLLDIKGAYQDLFGYDITDLARQAAKMSTKELQDITFATFVSRASKLAVKQKTLEARANEIQEALKANKSVDPKALSFGTEVFQELPDGFTWRKIVDPDATVIQSAVLDNSISGYSRYGAYGPFSNGRKALENGDVELFVLYDKNGIPVTNVEMIKGQKSGQFSMRQAQGNGPLTSNVTPDDYLPQLKAFINKTTPTDLPFNISREIRYIDAPEGFAKGGIVDKPLYDRAA